MLYPEVAERMAIVAQNTDSAAFQGRRIGLEKESLRVNAEGGITQTDHPESLGKALTNPTITTDFSEALLEMVTPPCASAESALDYLTSIHHYVVRHLPDHELLWNTSMPCILSGESSIRIAEYGHSHSGRMKNIYRRGLGLRYGKKMQAIAGIHFNFSLPESVWSQWEKWQSTSKGNVKLSAFGGSATLDTATAGYFHMSTNLLRIGWLVPYLFGSSPAVCHSFLNEEETEALQVFNDTTRFEPLGTSLRQGSIGYSYREDESIDLSVRHECFGTYLDDLLAHVSSAHPAYEKRGVKDRHGRYLQLNANRLQIENEYYSSVRPKQIPERGEMPLLAMQRRGIQYIELRSMDVSPFHPAGLDVESLKFLELMMLFSLLSDSAPLMCSEMSLNGANMLTVAHRGRQPELALETPDGAYRMMEWASNILSAMKPIAEYLDSTEESGGYLQSLKSQLSKFDDPSLTPSARVLDGMRESGSFFNFALDQSEQHQRQFLRTTGNPAHSSDIQSRIEASRNKFAELDQNSTDDSFDAFLSDYFSQLDEFAPADG